MNRKIHFFRFMPLKPGDLFSILYFLFTALLLIAPALFNRYPLIYSDSGTYINSSFGLVPPDDRPIGYGYFIRIFSWQASMWPVVFFQGLIGSILIFKTLQMIESKKDVFHYHLPVVVILTLFSSLGWYASQLMPDILVSYQFLVVLLFVFQKTKVIPSLFYLLLFLNFNTTHYSTLLVTVLLLTILFIYTLFGKKDTIRLLAVKKLGILFLVWFCSFQFLMLNNQANGNGYTLSTSSNVFLTARLSETGILKKYLNSNCNLHALSLCAVKTTFLPQQLNLSGKRMVHFKNQE